MPSLRTVKHSAECRASAQSADLVVFVALPTLQYLNAERPAFIVRTMEP